MKKIGLVALAGLFLFSVYSVLPDLMDAIRSFRMWVEADEIDWDEEVHGPGEPNPTAPADFSVLEIVPYAGMGEIGYLVRGEEPIEQSMMKINDTYSFWFTDNSIDKYPSYKDEFMDSTGPFTKTGSTIRYQNGYFKRVKFGGESDKELYSRNTNGYSYYKVPKGNYKAVLVAPVEGALKMYSSPTDGNILANYRNVNAYFVKKPTTLSLYSETKKYYVSCVTDVKNNTGDYDYDPATEVFTLNKGKGDYDVLFSDTKNDANGSGEYYMLSDYEIVTDNSGDYSWSIDYVEAGEGQGNYDRIPEAFTYERYWGGQYQWYPNEAGPTDVSLKSEYNTRGYCIENSGTADEKIWRKGQPATGNYQYTYHVQLVNNEWFKRFMLGVSSEQTKNCHVEVTTLTPTELNLPANQHYIQEANFIYIKKANNYDYISLYEKLNSAAKVAESKRYQTSNFQENDLNWSNVVTIFEKAIGLRGARPAIIIEDTVYTDAVNANGSSSYSGYKKTVAMKAGMWDGDNDNVVSATGTTNNIAKLYLMLIQRDAKEFYNQFINPENPSPYKIRGVNGLAAGVSATGSTGSFIRPDVEKAIRYSDGTYKIDSLYKTEDTALYWNKYTFLPFTIAMDGTITRYAYYYDSSKFPKVRNVVRDDGSTLWKLREDVPLPSNVEERDTVIRYKVIDNGSLNNYIKYSNFDEYGPNKLNDNVLVKGNWAIITGSTLNGNLTFSNQNMGEIYWDVNSHLISTGQIAAPKSSFTLGEIINVITNNGKGYANTGTDTTPIEAPKIRVLNIEPTAGFAESEAVIRSMLSKYSVNIVNMTSVEFNSNMEDINTQYDMIYIGAEASRFNVVGSSTVFNDSSFNGSVYHRGDRITTSEGVKNYIGNDFTSQKLSELTEYLAAGLPIVLDQSIYTKSTAVQSSTKLYSWLNTTIGSANPNLLNQSEYTLSKAVFMGKLIQAMSTERPKIKLLRPVLAETDDVVYVGTDEMLDLAFVLQPNGLVADEELRYKSYLYLDQNADGIFAESERLNPSTYGITESQYKIYFSSYDMSQKNGVYRWKIKLVKQRIDVNGTLHDTPVRSEVKGYTAVTHRQTIQILQITDNPDSDPSVYSLQNKATDPTSLFKYYSELNEAYRKDYNFAITTKSADEFMALYNEEPYSTANHEETNKLADYHVVIFDNQNTAELITDENGALTNLIYEIADGMGVLFTGGAVNPLIQNVYLAAGRGIFESQSTYARLNLFATGTDPYYNFNYIVSGLAGQLQNQATYRTTYLTRANASSITQYPYEMGDAIRISTNSFPWYPTIDYDRTSMAPLTGWYSLSDTRSPVVRAAGLSGETAANTYTGIYSSSPNDIKNNYYLLNRGKIYYSGIRLDQADTPGNDDEMKLFVNTLIACYKTSGRVISIPPSIKITEPTPIASKIELSPIDIGELTDFPITFMIEKSSSDVNLSILWNDNADLGDNWNKEIYRVGSDGAETLVTDPSSVPPSSIISYRVYIPVSSLEGSHKLTIIAKNKENKETKLDTTITYVSESIKLEITNYDLAKNDKNEQYLYIDIDYAAANETITDTRESDYLGTMSGIRIEFNIDNAATASKVDFTLTDQNDNHIVVNGRESLRIYKADNTDTFGLGSREIMSGSYYIDLPITIMSGVSQAALTLTAEVDSANYSSSTVILLRRSLFQLD